MRFLPSLMLLVLSACSSVAPPTAVLPVAARDAAAFSLNGRLAVRHGEERHSAGLRWQHQPHHDELLLQGPLGITAARISSDARSATLENGKLYEAQDVEALMQHVLGWGLPLPVLHHWLVGAVDASLPAATERDSLGRLTLLQQAGWEVHYQRYADDHADSLPTRITFSRDELQVKLLIDEWDLAPR